MVDRLIKFNEILDDCVNRITLNGETVESCLKLYPEHAMELEPYLRMTTRVAKTYTFVPSSAAKELARQRLYAERVALREISDDKGRRKASRGWGGLGWLPRWAAVTAIAALVILFTSFGAVAASSSASPGELLYPVKRSAEQALLALQFSPEGKAKVSLAYAQRRADEMAALIKEGDVPQLASLKEDLKQNLETFTRVIVQVGNEQEKAGLQTRLQENVVQSLNHLQTAAQEAPESIHQAAMDSFQAYSQTFSQAIESVTANVPTPVVTAMAPGILQLLATDPPPPNVEKVLITVNQIDVLLSAGDKTRWVNIIQEPQTFDLLRIAEIQKFLGQKHIDPGAYTKVRFLITEATAVAGGVERLVKVPSEMLILPSVFIIEEGKTTSVTLDFDGVRSLQISAQNEFWIKPVVNVLVHRPGQWEKKEEERGGEKRGKDKWTSKMSRAEFEGRVESVAPDNIVVKGVTIKLAPYTRIEGRPEVGQKVEIETQVQPDGSFLAIKIEFKEVKKEERSGRSESRGTTEKTVEISGAIQSINGSEWVVNGQKVKLTAQTEVKGQATVGSTVRLEGSTQVDGSILATEVTIIGGGRVEEKKQEEKRQEQGRTEIRLEGMIEKLNSTELTVGGRAIIITRETRLDGVPAIGVGAEVDGQLQPDGKVQATSIKILKKAEERGKDEGKDKGPSEQPKPPDRKDEEKKDGEKDGRGQDTQSFSGTIEKLGSGEWIISGKVILIGPNTKVEGTPAVGQRASIEGQLSPDGKVLASTIKVERGSDDGERRATETPRPPERQGGERGSPPRATTTITGRIEKASGTELTIDGKLIAIRPDTKVEGLIAIGSRAQVEGQQQADGKIAAISIKVTRVVDTKPKEDEKEKPKAPAGTPNAPEKKDDNKETSEKGAVILSGTVSSRSLTELVVDGKVVIISRQTEIEGIPAIGRKVKAKGQVREDGKIAATSIEVINPQETD